jgi:proteasome component ECM29
MKECLDLLFEAMSGRTWEGKEAVLEALVTVAIEGKDFFAANDSYFEKLENLMIKEVQKNNLVYKRYVLDYLASLYKVLNTRRFADFKEYLQEYSKFEQDPDEMDVDDDKQKPLLLAIQANSFKAIGSCIPKTKNLQGSSFFNIEPEVEWVASYLGDNLNAQVWNIRLSILDGLNTFLEKLDEDIILSEKSLSSIVNGCQSALSDGKYRSVREKASIILEVLSKKNYKLSRDMLTILEQIIDVERDAAIQDSLKKSVQLFQ